MYGFVNFFGLVAACLQGPGLRVVVERLEGKFDDVNTVSARGRDRSPKFLRDLEECLCSAILQVALGVVTLMDRLERREDDCM